MTQTSQVRKRFYVGNLFDGVTEIDLDKLFSKYGRLAQTEIKQKKDIDGRVTNTFGFVTLDLNHENQMSDVIRECNHLKWKKHVIKVQVAQESFLQRLQKERQDAANPTRDPVADPAEHDPAAAKKNGAAPETGRLPAQKTLGVVDFTEHPKDASSKPAKRRVYDSSSDEEDEPAAKMSKTSEHHVGDKSFSGSGFLSRLEEAFDGAEPKDEKGFWMNNTFAQTMSANRDAKPASGFSFLSRFGANRDVEDIAETRPVAGKRQNVFNDDDSDDDALPSESAQPPLSDSAKFGIKLREKAASQAAASDASAKETEPFFYSENDARFNEGVRFLTVRESMDRIRENYEEQRPVLAGIMKKKMRSRLKKQEKQSFSGGKRKARTKRGKKFVKK